MTAINAIATPQAAYIIADTACYWPDGEVGGFASKVITLPHLSMAFSTSGKMEQRGRVAKALLEIAYATSKAQLQLLNQQLSGSSAVVVTPPTNSGHSHATSRN